QMTEDRVVVPIGRTRLPTIEEIVGIKAIGPDREPIDGAVGLPAREGIWYIEGVFPDDGIAADNSRHVGIKEGFLDPARVRIIAVCAGVEAIGPKQICRATVVGAIFRNVTPNTEAETRLLPDIIRTPGTPDLDLSDRSSGGAQEIIRQDFAAAILHVEAVGA